MRPAFSIAIPYYQNPDFLIEAVESVVSQDWTNWELFVSTDKELPAEIIARVVKLVPEVHIVNNPSPGMASNWNHCVSLCRHQYTILLHSDDRLKPNYLSELVILIEQNQASAWFCGVDLIDENGDAVSTLADSVKKRIEPRSEVYLLEGDKGLANLLHGCFIYCPTLCYSTEVIRRYPFSDKWKMVTDLELYSRLLQDGHAICGTKRVLFDYRRHNENQTSIMTRNNERFIEEIALYNCIGTDEAFLAMQKTQKVAKRKVILRLHLLFQMIKSVLRFDFSHFVSLVKLLFK